MENEKTNRRACNHIRKARSGALKELILSFSDLTWRDKRNQGQAVVKQERADMEKWDLGTFTIGNETPASLCWNES